MGESVSDRRRLRDTIDNDNSNVLCVCITCCVCVLDIKTIPGVVWCCNTCIACPAAIHGRLLLVVRVPRVLTHKQQRTCDSGQFDVRTQLLYRVWLHTWSVFFFVRGLSLSEWYATSSRLSIDGFRDKSMELLDVRPLGQPMLESVRVWPPMNIRQYRDQFEWWLGQPHFFFSAVSSSLRVSVYGTESVKATVPSDVHKHVPPQDNGMAMGGRRPNSSVKRSLYGQWMRRRRKRWVIHQSRTPDNWYALNGFVEGVLYLVLMRLPRNTWIRNALWDSSIMVCIR